MVDGDISCGGMRVCTGVDNNEGELLLFDSCWFVFFGWGDPLLSQLLGLGERVCVRLSVIHSLTIPWCTRFAFISLSTVQTRYAWQFVKSPVALTWRSQSHSYGAPNIMLRLLLPVHEETFQILKKPRVHNAHTETPQHHDRQHRPPHMRKMLAVMRLYNFMHTATTRLGVVHPRQHYTKNNTFVQHQPRPNHTYTSSTVPTSGAPSATKLEPPPPNNAAPTVSYPVGPTPVGRPPFKSRSCRPPHSCRDTAVAPPTRGQ